MADMLESLAGNKMLMLKQEIAALRQRLAEVLQVSMMNLWKCISKARIFLRISS